MIHLKILAAGFVVFLVSVAIISLVMVALEIAINRPKTAGYTLLAMFFLGLIYWCGLEFYR